MKKKWKLVLTALEAVRYKDTTRWIKIKKHLKDAFESQLSASSLQIELNSVKMKYDNDVNTYLNRVEKLYFKLYNANLLNKLETTIRIIREPLKE